MYYIYYTIANFSKVFGVWFVLTIINQFVFFGACLQPYCILASIPHVSVITAIIIAITDKDDEEAKKKANEFSIKANIFWSLLFKWLFISAIAILMVMFIYGKFIKEQTSISTQNISNINSSNNIDLARKNQIDNCIKTSGGWKFSGNDIVCRKTNHYNKKYSLIIKTSPSDARVQIMNIKPIYYNNSNC